jgi:hypothetical protein
MVKDLVDRSNGCILLQARDLEPDFTWDTCGTDLGGSQIGGCDYFSYVFLESKEQLEGKLAVHLYQGSNI